MNSHKPTIRPAKAVCPAASTGQPLISAVRGGGSGERGSGAGPQPGSLCLEHHYHQQRAPLRCASARSNASLSIFSPHRGSAELLSNRRLAPAIILPLIYFTEFSPRWGFWAEGAKDAEECLSEFTAACAIFYEALNWPSGAFYCPFYFPATCRGGAGGGSPRVSQPECFMRFFPSFA